VRVSSFAQARNPDKILEEKANHLESLKIRDI